MGFEHDLLLGSRKQVKQKVFWRKTVELGMPKKGLKQGADVQRSTLLH